jgi:hypothetical protein
MIAVHSLMFVCMRVLWVCVTVNDEVGEPKPVRLDRIAPDLAMVHLDRHKIKWEDLHKNEDKPMAEGTLAPA